MGVNNLDIALICPKVKKEDIGLACTRKENRHRLRLHENPKKKVDICLLYARVKKVDINLVCMKIKNVYKGWGGTVE